MIKLPRPTSSARARMRSGKVLAMASSRLESACSVLGCGKPRCAKGYCTRHYQRYRKYSDPLATPRFDSDDIKRRRDAFFNANVDRSGGPDACWPWTRKPRPNGYGQLRGYTGPIGAHRFAWELAHGPIPDRLTIEHDCHDRDLSCLGEWGCPHRLCCNPAHMRLVTFGENVELAEDHRRRALRRPRTQVSMRPCSVTDCPNTVYTADCCVKHYRRLQRHGDTSTTLR